ncbi:MAG: hypothetical protein Q8K32_07175 [Archangium sp.]|nr:hypothetical protein [Archangium sp.]
MPAWKHPSLGPVEPIPPKMRPAKVWKHFYDEAEHWERLCRQDVGPMRAEAEAIGGILRVDQDALPGMEGQRLRQGRDLLVRHHDAAYGPAYQTEMASSETVWTPGTDAQRRHKALTPRSVFVVVQLDQPNWVVTAFRPHPPTRGVEWDEVDLWRHGAWYFRRETGMKPESLVRATAENLQRVSSVAPRSVRDVWWLASAVGYGRLLVEHTEIRAALPAAESTLSAVDENLLAELRRSLDWDGCLRRLASALKDARSEDAEEVLAASEELLAVAGVVDVVAQADAFCAEAEALIAWVPAEWVHLFHHAAARCEALGTSEHLVHRLWAAVEGAAVGAAMREIAPVVQPATRLVDALIPIEPRWRRWRERAGAKALGVSAAVAEWVRTGLDGVRIGQPAPTMGGAGATTETWEVRGRPAPNAPHFRVFVVDEEHPNGCEVTEHFTVSDGYLWRMDAGDQGALVVLIAGRSPIPGVGLESVLANVAEREDVFVGTREVNPPT